MESAVFFGWLACISVAAVTATGGSALTAGHFRKARKPAQSKVTKALVPHHSVPRLGSACLNEGITPWAAAKGHPWPSAANPASVPGCPLRNTFVQPAWLTGRRDQRPPRGGLTADLALPVVHPSDLFEQDLWEQSLLANAVFQSMKMLDVPTSSRASSLPQDFFAHAITAPLMQMIGAFSCVYECFSITHGIMHAVMNSQ